MCRKLIINSGIDKVIVRKNENDYEVIEVKTWVENDDLLNGKITYWVYTYNKEKIKWKII